MGLAERVKKYFSELSTRIHSFYSVKERAPGKIGLYLMKMDDNVVYVGKAVKEDVPAGEKKGLKRELLNQWQGGPGSNQRIYQNRDKLTVTMKLCQSKEEVLKKQKKLIEKYNTIEDGWNREEDIL